MYSLAGLCLPEKLISRNSFDSHFVCPRCSHRASNLNQQKFANLPWRWPIASFSEIKYWLAGVVQYRPRQGAFKDAGIVEYSIRKLSGSCQDSVRILSGSRQDSSPSSWVVEDKERRWIRKSNRFNENLSAHKTSKRIPGNPRESQRIPENPRESSIAFRISKHLEESQDDC